MERCFFIHPKLLKGNSIDSDSLNQLMGSLIYTLLFEGQIIISDSTFINTYDLRLATTNNIVKNMILNKNIIFATRVEELRKKDPIIEDTIQKNDDLNALLAKLNSTNDSQYQIIRPQTFVKSQFSDTMLTYIEF